MPTANASEISGARGTSAVSLSGMPSHHARLSVATAIQQPLTILTATARPGVAAGRGPPTNPPNNAPSTKIATAPITNLGTKRLVAAAGQKSCQESGCIACGLPDTRPLDTRILPKETCKQKTAASRTGRQP